MTRAPLWVLSLTFSASSRQQTTSKNDVASSHSCVWRFCQRRLTASPKVVVDCPLGVTRISGSRVTFPTRTTLFPFDISLPVLGSASYWFLVTGGFASGG